MRLFVFGAGFSGKAIAGRLAGEAERISGTARSFEKLDMLEDAGIQPFVFDGIDLTPDLKENLAAATHLVMSIAPGDGGDPVVPLIDGALDRLMPQLQWIGYLSTVGVYGNHDGAWVDETTKCRPVSQRSIARLEAESQWRALGADADVPTAIIRLSGIYGPGRNTFRNFETGKARRLIKPGQVFNRIHVADIAGTTALLARNMRGGTVNVTDDEPAPAQDLVTLAAELMGVDAPDPVDFKVAKLTAMARSFYGENKRVSNAAIKRAGYTFEYPNYRMALPAMWSSGEW